MSLFFLERPLLSFEVTVRGHAPPGTSGTYRPMNILNFEVLKVERVILQEEECGK